LASSTVSDPFVAAAIWSGAAALLLTLLLSLQIVRLRVGLRLDERRTARAQVKWRPHLHAAVAGEATPEMPALVARERLAFLTLWVHLQASLRGDGREALNDVARRLGLDLHARAMLSGRGRTERLLAMLVLGHLGDSHAWPLLQRHVGRDANAQSLTALWAMARIDPQAAAQYMTTLFIEREDWALAHVAGILQQAAEPVERELVALLPQLDPASLPRALRIAEAIRVSLPAPVLGAALRSSEVPVLIAALRGELTFEILGEVRALLAHEDWQVRISAVKALGRIGERSDVERLAALLGDPEWWVRYRAAQSLVGLPTLSRQEVVALRDTLTDRFGADMLTQVLAEKEMA
jgi:HEAT repeat protein